MKSLKKILAFAISLCLLIGAVPMFAMADDTAAEKTATFTYTNTFDDITGIADLEEDFYFGFDNTSGLDTTTTAYTADQAASYLGVNNDSILRYDGPDDKKDPRVYQGMMYAFYEKDTFNSFEVSADLKIQGYGGFTLLHAGPSLAGNVYGQGFTVAVRMDGSKLTLFLGNNTEAKGCLDFYFIKKKPDNVAEGSQTNAYWESTEVGAEFNLKLGFEDGVATAYVNGEAVATKSGLPVADYYVSIAEGKSNGWFDNFSVVSYDPIEVVEPEETYTYKYSNDFNSISSLKDLEDDFYFSYDATHSDRSFEANIEKTAEEACAYVSPLGGKLRRYDASDEPGHGEGCRAFWRQLYFFHDNAKFKNFEVELDITGANPSAFNMIHIAPSLKGNVFSQGYVVCMRGNAISIDDAASAKTNLNWWTIRTSTAVTSATTYKLKVVLKDGTLTVYCNDEYVAEKTGIADNYYYAAFTTGLSGGEWDNFTVKTQDEDFIVNEKLEKDGTYINNFDAMSKSDLAKDFAFYYDAPGSGWGWDNTDVVSANKGTAQYKNLFSVDGQIIRTFNGSYDKDSNQDGNTPWRSVMYYTYKNQKFTNFTLTVDAYMPGNGSSFNFITVGDMGHSHMYNNGFVVGFQNAGKVQIAKAGGLNDAWNLTSPVKFTTASDHKYTIVLTVEDGLASVSINGTEVIADFNVGAVNGYISLANGIDKNATWDNLSIVGDSNLSFAGNDSKTAALYATDVEGLEEIGYELAIGDKTVKVTADKIDAYAYGTAPFAVTKDGEVYYTDLDMSGEYDADDIVAFRQWFVYLAEVDTDLADLNKDNEVDIRDLVRMKKIEVNAADGYTPNENGYTFAFSFAAALEGVNGDVTATPYYVANGNTIYGDAETFTVADGAIEA